MSFNDLERGTAGGPGSTRGSPRPARKSNTPLPLYHAPGGSSRISPNDDPDDSLASASGSLSAEQTAELKRLADGVGAQIFKINSNTAAIQKLIKLSEARQRGNAAGGKEDRDWTKRAHDLVESTRAVVKATTPTLKQLSTLVVSNPDCPAPHKLTLSKLQREFEQSLQNFATAQKQSARRSKEELEGAKRAVNAQQKSAGAAAPSSSAVASGTSSQLVQIEDEQTHQAAGEAHEGQQEDQLQAQAQAIKPAGPSLAELEFQEALIAEREAEIREIESGVHELNEIFRDLGQIVQEQGGMIDNIEYNIGEIAVNTGEADRELVTAHDYQRKAGKRAACLLLIVGFVVAMVLLAILS